MLRHFIGKYVASLSRNGMYWIGLKWMIELDSVEVDSVGLNWMKLSRMKLDWSIVQILYAYLLIL